MKKLLLIILILPISSISKAQVSSSDAQAIQRLKEFYTQYMTALATAHPNNFSEHMRKCELLKERYCTKKLIKDIPKLADQYDCDPLIAAQDSREDCVQNLNFKKNNKKTNAYTVSYYYIDEYSKKKEIFTVNLTVVKEDGLYKMDSIFGTNLSETLP